MYCDEFGYEMLPMRGFQPVGKQMRLYKKDTDIPDPNPGLIATANAARYVGDLTRDVSMEYLQFAREQYSTLLPITTAIAQDQLEIARKNEKRADEYADYERNTFRPLEREMIDEARRFNTDAEVERRAGIRMADVENAYKSAREQTTRELARMGLNPNSSRFAFINSNLAMGQAADEAKAANQGRMESEGLARALRSDAAALGRNLPANATTAYGLTLNANKESLGSSFAPANYMNTAYGTTFQGLGTAAQGYGTAGNIYANEFDARMRGYTAQREADSAFWGGVGNLLGSVGGAVAYKKFNDGGSVKNGLHTGPGDVNGPGGPVDDKVPAMLSDGEYVIPADVVEKKGIKFFDEMVKKHHTPAAEQRKEMARKGLRRK